MSKFAIRNRWSGGVQFECELPADLIGRYLERQLDREYEDSSDGK